jgi:hypothetical protein
VRRIWRPFGDEPSCEAHPFDDRTRQERRQAPIELRPEVPAQHFPRGPGDRPFGRFRVGDRIFIGYVPIMKKNVPLLKKLDAWLEAAESDLHDMPILVIDDEADQASINTGATGLWTRP